MKSILLIIIMAIFFTCITSKSAAQQQYYYVEAFKEQEVKVVFKNDSTFTFQDLTGCNQFLFTGKYKKVDDGKSGYLIFDSVKLQKVLSSFNSELIFSISNGDTAWIVNTERIFIHKQPFIATSNNNINLQEIRYQKLKVYYIGLLGKEGFLKVFGNGSKREAKKRLLECKLPDVNFR